MEFGQICLRKGEEQDILRGGSWIYDNEIAWIDDYCVDGGVVEILDCKEQFLAWGYFNGKSRIAARVLSLSKEETALSSTSALRPPGISAAHWALRMPAAWYSASPTACPA